MASYVGLQLAGLGAPFAGVWVGLNLGFVVICVLGCVVG